MTGPQAPLPDRAAAARAQLRWALDDLGPAPCQTSRVPQAWDLDATVPVSVSMAPVAVEACCTCPVQAECLAVALAADERFGIWGGLTPTERQASG